MCKAATAPSGGETPGRLDVTGPYTSPVAKADFHWSAETEPHATRRKEILAKHPEIRSLFGPDVYIMHQVLLHSHPPAREEAGGTERWSRGGNTHAEADTSSSGQQRVASLSPTRHTWTQRFFCAARVFSTMSTTSSPTR
jgi:hypothetical protein